MYQNIITKEFINDNIRPYSVNDSLYEATVREAIQFDVKLPTNIITKLITDEIPDDMPESMLCQLRLAIGYFAYSRGVRSANVTLTKYGATSKSSDNSYPADSEKIVSDSTYYKNCGEKILDDIKCIYCDYLKTQEPITNKIVRDQYLKCNIIGD